MVGILKKIKQILKTVGDIAAPILNSIVPGLGPVISTVSEITQGIAGGGDNIIENYQAAKKSGKNFNFTDGLKSFFGGGNGEQVLNSLSDFNSEFKKVLGPVKGLSVKSNVQRPVAAMNTLTKSYGDLHPRLKLKDEYE
jgi:hypothetical protein